MMGVRPKNILGPKTSGYEKFLGPKILWFENVRSQKMTDDNDGAGGRRENTLTALQDTLTMAI